MEIYIFYTFIFIIGALLGSFFTLAIHRIPKGEKITHERSYCPKCKHKLGFLDLIPILSYIILKGKCRYCNERISAKYIFIEIASGLTFLAFGVACNIDLINIHIPDIIYIVIGTIYISTLILIGGLDRNIHNISKNIMLFGLIVEAMYIIYLYMSGVNIYRYVLYLFIMLILMIVETIYLRKKGKTLYPVQLLTLCIYIVMWTSEELAILSIILTLWIVAIEQIITNPKKELIESKEKRNIPIASWLCFSNIVLFVIESFLR